MRYLLMIYTQEGLWPSMSKEEQERGIAAFNAYTQALEDAGVLVGSNRLASPRSAATIRVVNGKPKVLDGPYAETKEQLGGFFLVEADDMNEALQIAARWPSARIGSIEVRPIEDGLPIERRYS